MQLARLSHTREKVCVCYACAVLCTVYRRGEGNETRRDKPLNSTHHHKKNTGTTNSVRKLSTLKRKSLAPSSVSHLTHRLHHTANEKNNLSQPKARDHLALLSGACTRPDGVNPRRHQSKFCIHEPKHARCFEPQAALVSKSRWRLELEAARTVPEKF